MAVTQGIVFGERYRRPAFLNDHPVVTREKLLPQVEEEVTWEAGSVLGLDSDGNIGLWTKDSASVLGILAGDVTLSTSEVTPATVYIHCDVVRRALVWDESVTDDDIANTAVPALRQAGIYA